MTDQKRFIGIDMSKKSFEVAIVSNADPQILRKKYKATHEDRQEFISSLRKDDVVALETGNSSFILAKRIQKQVGCTVYVLNAGKLHIIFKSLKKTDKEDALRIAKFIQRIPEEELPTVIIPGGEEMAMRSSATELIRLDRTRTQSINALQQSASDPCTTRSRMVGTVSTNSLKYNEDLGYATITHPLHPFKGQRFKVLKRRKVAGENTIIIQGSYRGTFAVPISWTQAGTGLCTPEVRGSSKTISGQLSEGETNIRRDLQHQSRAFKTERNIVKDLYEYYHRYLYTQGYWCFRDLSGQYAPGFYCRSFQRKRFAGGDR